MALGNVPVGEEVKPERRKASVRRDLNDMVRDPVGKVAEAKVFAVGFKAAMIWVFLERAEQILRDWMILAVFVTAMLMPDLLKKVMAMKLGHQSKDSTK